MTSEKKQAIIIFSKYPREGVVKTRLAKTMGTKFAVKFYKACAENTFNECEKLISDNTSVYIFYSDIKEEKLIVEWTSKKFLYNEQTGSNLGERMMNAFGHVFDDKAQNAIIIGTDLPDISSSIIMDAFKALENYHAVIGPSSDGGYYLLGMNKFHRHLFEDIKWSTNSVFRSTVKKIEQESLTVKILDELIDIDEQKDLINWSVNIRPDENNFLYKLLKEQKIFVH